MKHRPFLRWLLLSALMVVGCVAGQHYGAFNELWRGDTTYIGYTIIAMFTIFSVQCGYGTFKFSQWANEYDQDNVSSKAFFEVKESLGSIVECASFFSGLFTTLGMIGTVIGFVWALPALELFDPEVASSGALVTKKLASGVYPALYTTLVGMICAGLLRLQGFNLSIAMDAYNDDDEVLS